MAHVRFIVRSEAETDDISLVCEIIQFHNQVFWLGNLQRSVSFAQGLWWW